MNTRIVVRSLRIHSESERRDAHDPLTASQRVSGPEEIRTHLYRSYATHLQREGLFTPGVHPRLLFTSAAKSLRQQMREEELVWSKAHEEAYGKRPNKRAVNAWTTAYRRRTFLPLLYTARGTGVWTLAVDLLVQFEAYTPEQGTWWQYAGAYRFHLEGIPLPPPASWCIFLWEYGQRRAQEGEQVLKLALSRTPVTQERHLRLVKSE